ncbi:thymidine phosphorylase family protein [Thalassomonas actiniarum]|uniref:Putative thymidine phosphorylase n=1 Tax=Thalassomonas actiniarum TaxID=485447 RepID=A0AAE9YP66_9GAMM|nr:thymidine phosphorylase family protein [Thalassomonas actiniarum]WDD97668.1 thymidine phosphorylase family protein [Thalassomonas actiniarum]
MLKLKSVAIETYKENVAYLHRDCPLYRSEGFQALMKIEISVKDGERAVIAVLNIVNDDSIMDIDELGLSVQAFQQLGEQQGTPVYVAPARAPASLEEVRKKIAGETLSKKSFELITRDISENRYSKMEIAAFLVACSHSGLEREEVLYLTQAMVASGKKLSWDGSLVVDKHCIGGIPGNRTTMIIVPIVAAHGMLIPKTSSRAITSPAGTADTMEMLAKVDITNEQMQQVVQQHRGMLAWGGTAKLAPVDDILISVERPLSMDSSSQLVASILAKKIAAGSTHLLIDIPVGPTAKIHHTREALKLRKMFEYVGDHLGIYIEVILTNGSQPIGNGIGPALEARDVMKVLKNQVDAPGDLREKSLRLAGRILEFDPDVRGGQGYAIARDIVESGRALEKMQDIIQAQGKLLPEQAPATRVFEVRCQLSGYVHQIDNLQLAKIASLAGAPIDKYAGVELLCKIGDKVEKGDILYKIYACFESDFQFATELAAQKNGYSIYPQVPTEPEMFLV